ncbi:MAG: hypothetical protein M1839_008324 [Geoglossum umbratile]|nr:MAG: hypothetical protein M1839_008324 [Geoglossum umbratile]
MRVASPQVVKRDTHRSDCSQESNDAFAVYDVTKHRLRLWKDELPAGEKVCELHILRWRNRVRIPLSEVDDRAGVKTCVIKLDRLGREFNLRRRFMTEYKELYVLYGEKRELGTWETATDTRCGSPVGNATKARLV